MHLDQNHYSFMPDMGLERKWPPREEIEAAIHKIQAVYLSEQFEEGYWWYRLESNDTITAEYLMLLDFLGILDDEKKRLICSHILGNQRSDGSWAIYHGGPGDVSATVEAYFALKLAGMDPGTPEMSRSRDFILQKGGVSATRVFTKIFLALFGCFPWKSIPSLPTEIMLLPPQIFLSVYNFASWARSTLIPISVLLHLKPVKKISSDSRIDEIMQNGVCPPQKIDVLQRGFVLADKLLKLYDKVPLNGFRERGLRSAERWIVTHQEPSGDWAGIQPAMVNSLLALKVLGYSLNHPVMSRGLNALERFCIRQNGSLELQACISPIWDTALTLLALLRSGMSSHHPVIQKGAKWLLHRQVFTGGDWQVHVNSKPGGWAFEFDNDNFPDVDDSAVVLTVLGQVLDTNDGDIRRRLWCGVDWVLSMRSRDGGWGAFDKNNNKRYLNKIPFADLEACIDPSTADVTGRVLEMMGQYGYSKHHPIARRAIRFLYRNQERNGSWWGRWGVNYIYGTWCVLKGLASIGEDMTNDRVKLATGWLKERQNQDGGWGETCETYDDPELNGQGESTPSQTAWALLGLMAANEGNSKAVQNGIRFLLERQTEYGVWEEQQFTGTGFPKYFMLRYHNYRNCFPLMALGEYRKRFANS
jgi:squalene-hopene/tetraprenyl-beta-curcumene cyclase